uniref:Cytochrome b6-f complex subunit n=1 Tax=Ceramothamnion japonicum TaxID=218448 RepID=A0A1C9CD29_CERJP|nr:cytochrome b6-f complex subunit [Ceramium japonicum]AOM66285.1 cytochrome b6-f complex subunit [Ceramium japonicum]
MYYKLNSKILYYKYKSSKIVGYKSIYKKNKVVIIQFCDLTRIWILSNEIQYFIKNIKY